MVTLPSEPTHPEQDSQDVSQSGSQAPLGGAPTTILAFVGQIPDGDFLATEVVGSGDITAYAIDHGADDGVARMSLAVANFGDPATAGSVPRCPAPNPVTRS